MRVYIKNKLFSLRGNSTVKNDMGQDVFVVKGKLFSFTRKKRVCDMQGNELFSVRNKFFRLPLTSFKAFVIDADKKKIACVKKPFFSFNKYKVEGFKDEIEINGEFWSMHSQIIKNGAVIGNISRQIALTDAFALDGMPQDMPFLVALVIAVDNIADRIRHS
ncbi:MAG: LURP-one-related family protein [Clostridia bacterium]|nr:LURP-one-related family protein [Clostridia bacterium]